jgi:hypothetical protein
VVVWSHHHSCSATSMVVVSKRVPLMATYKPNRCPPVLVRR